MWDILCFNLLEHVSVPREVVLDFTFSWEAMLLIETTLSLQVRGQIVVVSKVEAFLEVLRYLFDYLLDLRHIKLLLFIFLFCLFSYEFTLFICRLFIIGIEKGNESYFLKSVDIRWCSVCTRLLVCREVADFVTLGSYDKMVEPINLNDTKEPAHPRCNHRSWIAHIQIVLFSF